MKQSHNEELKKCITLYKTRLQKILQRLEWSEEAVMKDFNTNSLASSVKDSVKKPHSPKVATYPDSCITKNSLVLKTIKLQEILQSDDVKAPRNFTELQANLTREQKLKIYEHVVENTDKLKNNTVDQVEEGEISLADILAQKKREEKKLNKRKFRKAKPTHIEEVRCLVDLQMQALEQFVGNKIRKDEDNTGCRDRNKRISRDERGHYKDYYKRVRYKGRSVERVISYDKRRSHSSRSKERKRCHRSRSKDNITYERKRRSRSHIKERRKRSRSNRKELAHQKTSNGRSRSRDIAKNERKHCNSKELTKERRKRSRSHSKERRKHMHSRQSPSKKRRKRSSSRSKDRKIRYSTDKEILNKKFRHSRSRSKEISYKRARDSDTYQMPNAREKGDKRCSNEKVLQEHEYQNSKTYSNRRDRENAREKRDNSRINERLSQKEEYHYSKTHSSRRDHEKAEEKVA